MVFRATGVKVGDKLLNLWTSSAPTEGSLGRSHHMAPNSSPDNERKKWPLKHVQNYLFFTKFLLGVLSQHVFAFKNAPHLGSSYKGKSLLVTN